MFRHLPILVIPWLCSCPDFHTQSSYHKSIAQEIGEDGRRESSTWEAAFRVTGAEVLDNREGAIDILCNENSVIAVYGVENGIGGLTFRTKCKRLYRSLKNSDCRRVFLREVSEELYESEFALMI